MKKEQKNSPNLRFKGFTEDWELCKLKEITERVKGNDGRMDLPTLTISAGQGWLNQKDRFSGNIAGKEQKNYTLLLKNELSYNHGNSKLAKYGAVFLLKTYEEALVPRVYHSFKSTKNSDPDFLEYIFATKKPDKELGKLVSSGARMDGLLNINYDDFSNIKINIPHVHEQKKISNLLRKIDNTITLHQRKLEQLKELKTAYLQVMFVSMKTKNNKVPKLRFADFGGEWDQRKSKELFIPKSEKNQPNLPVLSVTQDSGVVYRDQVGIDIKYDSTTLKNYKVVNKNDFVISLRSFQGGFELSDKKGITSPAYTIFVPKDIKLHDNLFWKTQFKTFQFIEALKTVTFGIRDGKSISFTEFGDLKLCFPKNKKEQQKIGKFFEELDYAISLHQNKLTQLKSLKKSYLQNMFI
ncbi:restriction endonuclease subunit S [Enterococcus faecalis]|uniref:restriction endonuclease subunit S n=1 Tax=Enterococcus faecalis TaxID=1351 RepID=UPI00404323A3